MKSYALLAQLVEALHRFCRGFGFKSRTGLNFFLALFYYCFSSVHYCEDRFQINKVSMFGKQTGIIFYSNRVYLKNFTASLECMGWFLAFDLKKDQQMNQNKQSK